MYNGMLVVWYDNGTVQPLVKSRFDNRFNLFQGNGSLQIHGLQIQDSGIFAVNILRDLNQTYTEVHLLVHEKINTHLELLSNVSGDGHCAVVVNCSTILNHWKVAKCNRTACRETDSGGMDKESSSVHIDISADKLISCKSSNPVTSGSISLIDLCPDDHSTDLDKVHNHHRSRLATYSIAGCFAVVLFSLVLNSSSRFNVSCK
ncbi:uncharacterized protein LOC108937891 isoform X2 [Scleropages formosus]|nr:uncharacterized protein LOC108937891 isoform X2 [Scleropages formosus]